MRFIGLISTVILARLLTPEDFGIVAMASIVIGLLYSLSEFGVDAYLIRETNLNKKYYDTAWTLNIIQHTIVALSLVALSPFAAKYFNDSRVTPVINLLAIGAFIQGFENIGVVFFRKELNFKKDFRFNITKRILLFFVTIGLAFELKSYWALAISNVVGSLLGVLISFLIHSYRPRLSFYKLINMLRFSIYAMILNIGKFINNKLDVIVIGGMSNTSYLGTYNISSELSAMATKEVVVPIGRGLFPNFSKLSEQPKKLQEAFLYSLSVIAILCFPLGIGLWVVTEDFVLVVLGYQWLKAIPLIKWLVIYGTLSSLIDVMNGSIMLVIHRERLSAFIMWLRVSVFTGLVLVAGLYFGEEYIAPAVALSSIVFFPVVIFSLSRSLKVKYLEVISVLIRPILAALLMALAIIEVHSLQYFEVPLVRLGVDILVGALIYSILIFILWFLTKRPDGIEKVIFQYLFKK